MFYYFIFACITSLLLIITPVSGKWAEGELYTTEDWKFITRFCFLSLKGIMKYQFEYPESYGNQEILLYYDSVDQWLSVYHSDKNCTQRIVVIEPKSNAIIQLGHGYGCVTENITGIPKYVCSGERVFSHARERWWYLAASHCMPKNGEPLGISLKYRIHMMNGPEGDYLHREYSADEFYILPIDVAFLIMYTMLSVLTVVCAVFLRRKQLLHTTYKMYMVSVFMWTFYLFLMSIAYGVYGNDGLEWKLQSIKYAARAFEAISTLIFLLMLVLIGKGYTIVRGKLSMESTIKITVFMIVYIVTYVVIFIWQGIIFDPGLVLYVYESPPGYALIALRIIGFIWFCYSISFTLANYKGKEAFYWFLIIFYTLWFLAGPIVILVAMKSIALWTREKTVNAVENFVALCGHVFFLILTRPSAANTNFPYHLKTSQIDVLQYAYQSEDSNVRYSNQEHAVKISMPGSCPHPDLTSLFSVDNNTKPLMKTEDSAIYNSSNNYKDVMAATRYQGLGTGTVTELSDINNSESIASSNGDYDNFPESSDLHTKLI